MKHIVGLLKATAVAGAAILAAYGLWEAGLWLENLPGLDGDTADMVRWVPLGAAAWLAAIGAVNWAARRVGAGAEGRSTPARPAQKGEMDVVVGYAAGRPVLVPERDRYLHTLVVGTTGTGKSSRVLKPMIWQDLRKKAAGTRLGLTVIEPKGDLVADVAEMCRALGIPYVLVDPEREDTARFNPLEGDPEVAAEVMRTVLAALFGKQEAFFSLVQQGLVKYTIRMLKELRGDDVTLPDVLTALMEAEVLRQFLQEYQQRGGDPLVVRFFETEVLGRLADKFFQFALGVRMQVGDIVGNNLLRRVLTGKSDIDLDRHLRDGGVFLVNTCMGRLGALGDAFGQFVMLHVQYAVFRRPRPESERIPHMLYIDEFPRYVNPDFEKMLALGRSYRCATVLACQSTSQLVLDAKPQLREILLGNCRNKILLNLDDASDAERFSRELGEELVEVERWTLRRMPGGWLGPRYAPEAKQVEEKRDRRFTGDALLHLPAFHGVVKVTVDGQPQRAVLCRLELSEFDRDRARWAKELERRAATDVAGAEESRHGGVGKPAVPEKETGGVGSGPVEGTATAGRAVPVGQFFPVRQRDTGA